MFSRAAQERRIRFALAAVLGLALAVAAAGCGGDKDEPAPAEQTRRALVPVQEDTAAAAAETTTVAVPADAGPDAGEGAPVPQAVADGSGVSAALKPAGGEKPVAGGPRSAARVRGAEPAASGEGGFSLQLGSFARADNADRQAARVRELGYPAELEVATLGGRTYHRVVLRGLSDRAEAERLGEHIRSALGITYLVRQK